MGVSMTDAVNQRYDRFSRCKSVFHDIYLRSEIFYQRSIMAQDLFWPKQYFGTIHSLTQ